MSGRAVALAALALAFAPPAWAAGTCEPADPAAVAGWAGVWASESADSNVQGISGREGARPDLHLIGIDAPWTDEGWLRMREMVRIGGNPANKQAGWGFPMMMDSFSELKFVISPAETAIINQYREVRSIYTDGRGHMPEDERWATNWGDSVGCWEGDTLVIDTVGVRYDPSFNPFAPPLSEGAHFVERLRLVAPGRLENVMTVTDPAYLTGPWTATIVYRPAGIERLVQDAFEDRNDTVGQTVIAPRAAFDASSFPPEFAQSAAELDRAVGRYTMDGAPLQVVVERRGERLFFMVPPVLTSFLPLYSTGPLAFDAIDGGTFRFTTDAGGAVTGFTGTTPDGAPQSGKRLP